MNWRESLSGAAQAAAAFLAGVLAADGDPFSDPRWGHADGGPGVGGGMTKAGVSVSSSAALNHSTFYACLKIISETFARVPAVTYFEKVEGEDRVREYSSPYYDALLVRPNRWQTPWWFQQTWAVHKLMAGNFLAEVVQEGAGYELVPLHPHRTEIVEPDDDQSGPSYITWSRAGRPRTLLRDELIHDPLMSGEGWKGMSVLQAARESLGQGLAMNDFQGRLVTRGLRHRGVLTHPKHFSPKARTELQQDATSTLWTESGILMLQEDVKFAALSITPQEAQLLEQLEFNVATIARFFGINHAKLGFSKEGFSYASVEQFILDFISSTMDPYFCSAEQELNRTLVVQPRHFVEFLRQALVQADIRTRWMAYAIGLNHEVFTPNDVRRLENLPKRDGGDQPRPRKGVQIATDDQRQAAVSAWDREWEGRVVDLERRMAAARREETDNSRARGWAEAAARALVRREIKFVAALDSAAEGDRDASVREFYEAHARRLERDLGLAAGEAAVWCEARANGRGSSKAATVRELVNLAMGGSRAA
ncbi:MAG: phage portal protein [Vicinamibacteria bacterium]|nr:phage portal protein [Vicinamibacteria bacterium]